MGKICEKRKKEGILSTPLSGTLDTLLGLCSNKLHIIIYHCNQVLFIFLFRTVLKRESWISSSLYGFSKAVEVFGMERYKKNVKRVNNASFFSFCVFDSFKSQVLHYLEPLYRPCLCLVNYQLFYDVFGLDTTN